MRFSDEERERLTDRVGQAAMDALDRVRDDPGAMLADAWRRMGVAALAVAEPALLPSGTVAILASDLRVGLKYALAATQLDRSTVDEHRSLCRLAVAIGFPQEWTMDPLPEGDRWPSTSPG